MQIVNPKLLFLLLFITISATAQNKNKTIGFKENKGQIIDQKGKPNNAIKYLLNSGGLNVQLRKNGFSYDVYEAKKHPIKNCQNEKKKPLPFPSKDNENLPDYTVEYQFHRIDIDFVNSNPKVELLTEQKSTDFDNYYNIPNKPEGITGVYQYKQITYKNIYPNIDVVFTIPNDPQKTVEYNFVIHPKGKLSDIQLKFNGAETDLVDNKLQMNVRFGKMEETLPASWIEDGTAKKEITIGYTKIKKNVYGFESSHQVTDKTVIIDPVPIRLWGTYYGGDSTDYCFDITTNSNNDVYITGNTWSSTNIATNGTHQSNLSGTSNLFFTKFDTDGKRLWGTYFYYDIGLFNSHIAKIKSDSNNNLYFAASEQYNTNIATVGSFQPTKNDWSDVFLVKLNNLGIREWATYYGGNGNDELLSLCLDSSNNIYISGQTSSTDVMSTPGSHQINNSNNSNDGFIAKFDSTGNRIWGTFYGGNGGDGFFNVSISNDGYLYATGTQNSSNNISTPGAYQEFSNGSSGGMIVKFTLDGQRVWGTYFLNDTYVFDAKLQGNNLYLTGKTWNKTTIATSNTLYDQFQTIQTGTEGSQLSSDSNSFVISFNVQTKAKNWGSYFIELIRGIDVNNNGEVYFSGDTNLNNGITTADGYIPDKGIGTKVYLIKLNNTGQRIWGTYYGGNIDQLLGYVHIDNQQSIYLLGVTSSPEGIATLDAHQLTLSDSHDSFLAKFHECLSNPQATSNSPVCIGKNLELNASGGTNYSWTGPNGFTSTDQNPIITNATISNSGEYSCLITGTGGCDDTKKISIVIGDIEAPVPNIATLPTITGDCHTSITIIPTATDTCAGAITATTASPLSYSLPGTYTVVWDYDDGNGNISHQNQTVTISNQPLPTATSTQSFCIQQNASLNNINITGQNLKWYDAQTAGNLLLNTTLLQDRKTYYASQTINGCESERVPVNINIQNTLAPTGDATQSFCASKTPNVSSFMVFGTEIKWYDSSTLGNLLMNNTPLVDGKTYYATQTINNCEGPRFGITVSIVNPPNAPTPNSNQAFCKSENATLNNIQISGQNIKWYDTNSSATSLPNTALLENNKTYYASSQTVGCESDRTAVLIQINDTALPTGSNNQQFCIDENATIANLNITGTNLKWYDSAINGNILQESTLQNGIYYATQTLNNCESERLTVSVKIQDTPIPIADSPQIFCIQKNALIRDIAISGQNIKWYDSNTSSVSMAESTLLTNGITYYASQLINNCESERIPVAINILKATAADCINLVDELPFPKFFTPNGDGFNDFWTIDFAYLAPNTKIKIYDRYGKLIKELTSDTSWDGTYLNLPLPSTDYWFVVTRLNGAEFRAHFSLKR